MTHYDLSPAACARYLAYEAERNHDLERANAWREESWRLWDKKTNLRFDPTGYTYYNADRTIREGYSGMLWAGYPLSHYDRINMETDLYIIAMQYEMDKYLGVNLATGEVLSP